MEQVIAPWQTMLGRARRAMAGGKEILVPTGQVRPMRGQPRVHFDVESLKRLVESLRTIGQIYPGIVRAIPAHGVVRYELLDGERRWRAARAAGLEYRALLVTVDDDAAGFLIAAVANFNRESHTPLEVSDAIKRMRALDMPLDEIAAALGLSAVWTAKMRSLQRLTPAVRALMDPTLADAERLSVTAAIQIAKVDGSLQLELARRHLTKEVSIGGLREEAVTVSRDAGTPIRMRTPKPADRWRSIERQSAQLRRTAEDLDRQLRDGASETIGDRDVDPICQDLRTAASLAKDVAAQVQRVARARVATSHPSSAA